MDLKYTEIFKNTTFLLYKALLFIFCLELFQVFTSPEYYITDRNAA